MSTTQTLKDLKSPQVIYLQGPDRNANTVNLPENSNSESLVFVSSSDQIQTAINNQAGIIIALNKIDLKLIPHDQTAFTCSNMALAMAAVLPLFDQTQSVWVTEPQISPQAFIHPSARIGPNVTIQAFAWIGANVIIGAHCRIGAHAVIQDRSLVGQGSIIYPNVFIGTDTELGVHCEIFANSSIATPGFGFATGPGFKHHKIPQIGRVVLGDFVTIGANCTIDRATIHQTVIKSGTKMDDLCHLAHNCEIGEDSLIAAGFMTAGSTKIGNRFMVGGSSVVADHIVVVDDVVIAGRSAVTNDIKEKGQYGGYPLQPLREALKTIATMAQLVSIRKQLSKISKHLQLDQE